MGRKSAAAPIDVALVTKLLLLGGLGSLGVLDASGSSNTHALLAWLTLLALPIGLIGASIGARFWPHGLLIPALWSFVMVFSNLYADHPLPAPMGGMGAVGGLYCGGFALGSLLPNGHIRPACIALYTLLLLVGSAQGGGLGQPESAPARHQPRLARTLVNLSPLVFSYECAGVDWTHDNRKVYTQSGVEWFPRRSYNGRLAGPAALSLGALFAFLADRRRRTHSQVTQD